MLQLSITSYQVACMAKRKSPECLSKGRPAATINEAIELVKEDGWSYTENVGSICPRCTPPPSDMQKEKSG